MCPCLRRAPSLPSTLTAAASARSRTSIGLERLDGETVVEVADLLRPATRRQLHAGDIGPFPPQCPGELRRQILHGKGRHGRRLLAQRGPQVRTAGALSGVVVGSLLARPIDLAIGGVQIHRHRATQRHPALGRQHPDGSADQFRARGLDPDELLGAEPASQGGARGRGRDSRHRRQLGRGDIGALPIQRGQRVSAQQLRRRQCDQQLSGAHAAGRLLDRSDRTIDDTDNIQVVNGLSERDDTRRRGQRRILGTDTDPPGNMPPDLLPTRLTTTYSLHRRGASPAWVSTASTTAILQAGQAPSSSHTRITRPLPADPGLYCWTASVVRPSKPVVAHASDSRTMHRRAAVGSRDGCGHVPYGRRRTESTATALQS